MTKLAKTQPANMYMQEIKRLEVENRDLQQQLLSARTAHKVSLAAHALEMGERKLKTFKKEE